MNSKDEKIEELEAQLNSQASQPEIAAEPSDLYQLTSNEEAMSYLENRGFVPHEIAERIENELVSKNKAQADNELVPYEGMEGFFRINNVRVINHKWVLASFTDGTYWGDLFLTYDIDEEGVISFETKEAFVYPRN